MHVLIIGFGSIGKRHFSILGAMGGVEEVHLVTKQNIAGEVCFHSLQDVHVLDDYDYFIIANETVHHYEQLKLLCSKVTQKKILVEKPLYDKLYKNISLNKNTVVTAYNLRFHPVLQRLKEMLKNQEVYYANVFCGQYLPTWRPQQDYRESYSADLTKGGGVLRDLSHELDYSSWLFGGFDKFQYLSVKRSDLEIKSDDIFTAVGVTKKNTIVNVTLDYISKHPIRRLIIHTQNLTIEADMIKGLIVASDKTGLLTQEVFDSEDRNFTYTKMHEAVLNAEANSLCSFEEGLEIVSLIDGVHFEGY